MQREIERDHITTSNTNAECTMWRGLHDCVVMVKIDDQRQNVQTNAIKNIESRSTVEKVIVMIHDSVLESSSTNLGVSRGRAHSLEKGPRRN